MKRHIPGVALPTLLFATVIAGSASAAPLSPFSPFPPFPMTRTVNCPKDPQTFATIQAAIDASAPGDTVVVCEGIYPENVNLHVANLTLVSKIKGAAKIIAPNHNAPAIQINATGDTIRGFALENGSVGIFAGDGTGSAKIEKNLIFDNTDGISFHNSFGNKVLENIIVDNDNNGVLDFETSVVRELPFPIPSPTPTPLREENVYEKNEVSYNGTNGIFINTLQVTLAEVEPRAVIVANEITNNGNDGVLLNFSNNVIVKKNKLDFNGADGIELIQSSRNLISCNEANANGASIGVCGTTGNCAGIRIHTGTENKVVKNEAFQNIVFDAQDNTNGSEPGNVANDWKDNKCKKGAPPRLCEEHHLM